MTTPSMSAKPVDRTWRVVVAIENPERRAEVTRLLLHEAERPHAVVETASADATLRAVLEAPEGAPDCLVLDEGLPGARTPDLLAALAKPDGHAACAAVVLTADGARGSRQRALAAGAQGVLGRGWTTAESLTQAIEQAVERLALIRGREQAEQELADVNRHKDEFLAMLAHELRNPLAPIRNALEILRGGDASGEVAARLHAMMERQLGHLVRLVDDLLDLSRISHGRVALHSERIPLASILEHAVELGRPSIDASGHTLSIRTPAEPVWIDGDPTRLAQVVGNLLDNAAKFTTAGGRIELSTHVDGDEAVVRVADDGIGIAADRLPRVFERFGQVDRGLAGTTEGLGIGLSLARELVEMHGGTLVGESAGLGRGSTFTVRLPLASAAPGRASQAVAPAPARATHRRVLVVDDNVEAAEMLAMLLELSGHDVSIAHSGPQALDAVRTWRPELVFLDIGMPEMSGHEVARRLRADPATASTVLVALTGWGSEADRHASKDAGFDLHLVKPAGREEIAKVLARSWPVAAERSGGVEGERRERVD